MRDTAIAPIVFWFGTGVALLLALSVALATAQADSQIRELFGGDLVSCWHIQGHYYSCSFT